MRFNECAVASDKVVSARKEIRSAHVEILKMEVGEERGQEWTAPKRRGPPIVPRGKRVPWSIFISGKSLPWLFQALAFVFLIPQWFTVFSGWASMLVLYGTYTAHDERMKPVVSAECAYSHWTDGM